MCVSLLGVCVSVCLSLRCVCLSLRCVCLLDVCVSLRCVCLLDVCQVKSSHLYLYSAFNNTNCNKALHNIKIGKFVNNVK